MTIHEGVSSIGERAFSQCSSLRKINIPSSAVSIDDSAFWNCKSLVSINIHKNNKNYTSVDGIVFNKNKTMLICYGAGRNYDSFYIPACVTRIGKGAFYGCEKLNNITIPGTVRTVGRNAFYGCSGLKSVIVRNGVTTFGDSVFWGCSSLTSVELPGSISTISFAMFRECRSLTDLKLPESITLIDNLAFYGCTSLKKLAIPKNCTSIGNFVFYDCNSMKFAEIPDSVKGIGYGSYGFYYNRDKSCDARNSSFVLYGKKDGTAQKYAAKHGFVFVSGKAPADIRLSKGVITLGLNETFKLNAVVGPDNSSAHKIGWRTSSSKILTVDKSGNVKAVGIGTAWITARTQNGLEKSCRITVKKAPGSVRISRTSLTMRVGDAAQLSSIIPDGTGCAKRVFRSDNNKVVRMTNTNWTGRFTAVSKGNATVTVRTYNGKESSCKIRVI